jgi:hypothetical protein
VFGLRDAFDKSEKRNDRQPFESIESRLVVFAVGYLGSRCVPKIYNPYYTKIPSRGRAQ